MRVLLVDDHPLMLSALRVVVQGLGDDMTVVCAGSAQAARNTLHHDGRFDLVMLDLQLGDANGFAVLAELRKRYPDIPVVVFSTSERTSDVIRAIEQGAMGYVPKSASNKILLEALRLVLSGSVYVPSTAMMDSDDAPPARSTAPALARHQADPRLPALTSRQVSVLQHMLQGKSNKMIAQELGVSPETVKDHVSAVLRALGVQSRTQAVLKVGRMMREGLQPPWRLPQAQTM